MAIRLDAAGANPYSTIYHEYFHSITTPCFPSLPTWLAEGLAEFYGNTQATELEAGMGLPNEAFLSRRKRDPPIPLDVLLQVDLASPYCHERNKTSMFYAESWALTHYLLVGDDSTHRPLLLDCLSAINRGASPLEAAREILGDLSALQKSSNPLLQIQRRR